MVKKEKSSLPLVKFAPKIQLSRNRRKYPPIVNRLSVLEGRGIYGEYHGTFYEFVILLRQINPLTIVLTNM